MYDPLPNDKIWTFKRLQSIETGRSLNNKLSLSLRLVSDNLNGAI